MNVFNVIENMELSTSSDLSENAGNNTTWLNENGESEKLTISVLFYVFLILMLICVCINSRIVFVVVVHGKSNLRSVQKLMVQYSTICICYSIHIFFEFIGKTKSRMTYMTSPEICRAFSYFRHVIYGTFPLNAAVLVYERVTGPSIPFGKATEYKFIVGIWLVSVFVNVPEIFHVEFIIYNNTTIGQCPQDLSLDSRGEQLAYELIYFLAYYLLPCFYMALCVYKIRFMLKMILKFERVRRVRMKRRVLRLLFVLLNTMAFVLLWLPTGILSLVYTILQSYQEKAGESIIVLAFTMTMQYILLCFAPLMYMMMNGDLQPIFPGCTLYQGNVLAERRRDWRRMASRAPKNAGESSNEMKMAMFGVERGEVGLEGDREFGIPVELREIPVVRIQAPSSRPLISPACSMDEIEDCALVVRVKENPQTTLVLN